MNVRKANIETDALDVFEGAKNFLSRMDYPVCPGDDDLMEALAFIIDFEAAEILVADDNGIVGGIGLVFGPALFSRKVVMAEELFWWTAEDAPKATAFRLIRAARRVAIERGATFLSCKMLTSSPAKVGRIYEAMGMREIETSFMGRL